MAHSLKTGLSILYFIIFWLPIHGINSFTVSLYKDTSQTWRSALYPNSWNPGHKDTVGRFLHDFSYAGYHQGEKELPHISKNIIDVTKPPYKADNTGKIDVTVAIQQALDDVGQAGGGVVYLPAGTYKINPGTNDYALWIRFDSTVLRGAGTEFTFICNNATVMRNKSMIHVMGQDCNWAGITGTTVKIRHDLLYPTRIIPVENVTNYHKGEDIILRTGETPEFINEHKMTGIWTNWSSRVMFLRTIDSIDVFNNLIYIDSPTRYPMKTRDNARIYRAKKHLTECGIEHLSIGNRENQKDGWDEESYKSSGTGAYEVHFSHMIEFVHSQNCWIKNVNTFKPSQNTNEVHVLSNCLIMNQCRNITVDSCFFQKPQYEGGGGNGYMFTLQSNDCLVKNSRANHSRHNYDFKMPYSNGNVLFNCRGENSKYSSDFHMYLSMSNLLDNFHVDGDYLESTFRPYGGEEIHGYSSTQSVFYNTKGLSYHTNKNYIIDSRQFGWGYVIGTSGLANQIRLTPVEGKKNGYGFDTSPRDFAEGIGKGESLFPHSLYLDQLHKRLNDTSRNKPHELRIKLVDNETQQVIKDAEVRILHRSLLTNYHGEVVFDNLISSFHISIEHNDYVPVYNKHTIAYSDTTLIFYLTEKTYDVNIKVIDGVDDMPFKGIFIELGPSGENADDNGMAGFNFKKGSYSYTIFKKYYIPETGEILISSDTTITITMVRTHADIKFRLHDNGEQIHNALIILGNDSIYSNTEGYAAFAEKKVSSTYQYQVIKGGYNDVSGSIFLITDTTLKIELSTSLVNNLKIFGRGYLHIWPVPVSDRIHVQLSPNVKSLKIDVYKISGVHILHQTCSSSCIINTEFLEQGIYVLKAYSMELNGEDSFKFVKW